MIQELILQTVLYKETKSLHVKDIYDKQIHSDIQLFNFRKEINFADIILHVEDIYTVHIYTQTFNFSILRMENKSYQFNTLHKCTNVCLSHDEKEK